MEHQFEAEELILRDEQIIGQTERFKIEASSFKLQSFNRQTSNLQTS
jgi:hypothetical protein